MLEGELPASAPIHAKETKEVERRGVDLVLARETRAGPHSPSSRPSTTRASTSCPLTPNGDTYRIEVKARIDGATDFFVTHNEVMTGKNAVPRYRLALVRVDPRGAQHDEVRYLDDPFASTDLGDFEATGIRGDWAKMWAKGRRRSERRAQRMDCSGSGLTGRLGVDQVGDIDGELTCQQEDRVESGVPRAGPSRAVLGVVPVVLDVLDLVARYAGPVRELLLGQPRASLSARTLSPSSETARTYASGGWPAGHELTLLGPVSRVRTTDWVL